MISHSEFELLKLARKRSIDGATFWRKNWDLAEDDLRFLSGEQWHQNVIAERELEQRPCLTNNVLPSYVDQIVGDQRQNRPSIKVSAVDAVRGNKISGLTTARDYEIAEVLSGLIKNIEYSCDAETSYDIAFQAAVESGFGFLRVRSDYSSDDSFEQDIIIDHVENQFSVILDPNARERDFSDMDWCIINDEMPKKEFEEKYPNARSDSLSEDYQELSTWFAENTVRVSEYFTRESVTEEIALLSDGRTVKIEHSKSFLDELAALGIEVTKKRKVKTHKVFWRKITGLDILEGPVEIPSSTIPVIPVWGKSITVKKETIFRSLIRYAKDAQRMANYWDSAATECTALAPKAPFIGQEGHVEGRETEWQTANTVNRSLLTYTPQFAGDPGPQRSQPAFVPSAEITMAMQNVDKIKSTIGMFDASLGAQGAEISGKAIIARQRQGDRGSYAFIDNLSKSIRRVGKILVEMIPRIYDTERVVRLKFKDETEDFVQLNQQVFDEQSRQWITINDLGVAKYDVVVTTGPAFATQKIEAVESMTAFAQAVPSAAAVVADLIAQNMDWLGADVISERLKKIMPPGVLTSKEREQIQQDMPQQPSPEQLLAEMEMNVRSEEAKAEAVKAQISVDLAKMKVEEAKIKLQAFNQQHAALKTTDTEINRDLIREYVAEAIAEFMTQQQEQQRNA